MTDHVHVADQAARDRALDPATSFIVQAPAGSGKTGLLTQRYLVLLARAEHPEEVVAITFTRKAANEMRERVLKSLDEARTANRPDESHKAHTWDLARTVHDRDIALQWHLALNPERLRIFTIDSFCSALARQMPVLSRFGAPPTASDDPEQLYRDAAQAALAHLEENDEWSDSIARLLRHFDNNMPVARLQIAEMLARRDQWMRHLIDGRNSTERRAHLEAALLSINLAALEKLAATAPAGLAQEVAAMARFASGNLADKPDRRVHGCANLIAWPGKGLEQRNQWEGLAELLLTNEGDWRKTINVNNGFPPRKKGSKQPEDPLREEMKERMLALLGQLRAVPPEFLEALAGIRVLPADRYDDTSWEVIEALTDVLLLALREFRVACASTGQADFAEIALGALLALGSDDEPTDLALHLDYSIRHLLVDEFQDTSVSQFELLGRLTAGWQRGDGRTLFVVGDPMQSIYRFRQADVGQYLKARQVGVGSVKLEPLTLSVNFRSQAGVVEWVNGMFSNILPARDDIATGAVSYTKAVAYHANAGSQAVQVHPYIDDEGDAESQQVAALVAAARQSQPGGSIAVLVRSRTHLARIAPRLKDAALAFRAVDIEALDERPVVQDLFSLTRALTHAADRAAWLAILRAPWCGLLLADLESLVTNAPHESVWQLMRDPARLDALGADGRARLMRMRDLLAPALARVGHDRLRRVVEGAWFALGGGACVEKETDLEDARLYLDLLDALDEGGTLPDNRLLVERMNQLFAQPDVQAPDTLQLMTIHKAKGLEFDTVILPGLGRRPRNDSSPLLRWMQTTEQSASNLLLAPIRATGADHDALYHYIGACEAKKARNENGRLLYVAATRAKKHLHLLGSVKCNDKNELNPPAQTTLLALLWPKLGEAFEAVKNESTAAPAALAISPSGENLRRLHERWQAPALPADVVWAAGSLPPLPDGLPAVEFDWASETTRHVGSVVHRALQQVGREGIAHWTPERLKALASGFEQALARQGVPQDKLKDAVLRVHEAVSRALKDQRGQWLFDPAHQEAKSEFPLSFNDDGQLATVVIDRTFIDKDGTRWIVDFKTGHTGGGVEQFLNREQERYRGQLEKYAEVLMKLDKRPVKLGLYFPLLGGWREWEAS